MNDITKWEHTREAFENSYIGSEDSIGAYYPASGPLVYKSLTVQRSWESWCRALQFAQDNPDEL